MTNHGPTQASGVSVVDNLPAGLSFVSLTKDRRVGCHNTATMVTCGVRNLGPGNSIHATITVMPAGPGTFTNVATVSANDPNPDSNSASATTIIAAAADMAVTKTASGASVAVGSPVTYTVVATNNEPDITTGVSVTDTLPAGISFSAASATQGVCLPASGVVSCAIGTLATAASATITVVGEGTIPGPQTDTAAVSANQPDPNPANNSASVTTNVMASADLAITKTASAGSVVVGSPVTYTLVATNHGPSPATGVGISDTLPTGESLAGSSSSQGTCTGATTLTCALGSLANGSSATVTVVATTTQAATITNTATVSGNEPDANPANNNASVTVTVAKASPSLSTVPSESVPAGGTVSDAATLTGGNAPGGSVTFKLYGPGDTDCTTAIATRTGTISNATASSGSAVAGAAGTYRWTASYPGDAHNNAASSPCGAEQVVVAAQVLTGRAYGLGGRLVVLLFGNPLAVAPTPDTGPVSTTSTSTTSTPCVATFGGHVSAHNVCASVSTTSFPGKSTAVASVGDAQVGSLLTGIPTVVIPGARSSSTTTCTGSSGTTTIDYLKVGSTVVIATPTAVAPNTRITVGGLTLTLNEQVPITGPERGLTVDAAHLRAAGLSPTDLVVASSESDIGNCP